MANTGAPQSQEPDMADTSILLPLLTDIQADIDHTLSVHPDADDTNLVTLTAATSAFLLREFHPRSDNIPKGVINSVLEIFHYCIPCTRIVNALLDNPYFMAILATCAPQLLPTANNANWHPSQAKPTISYALAAASTRTLVYPRGCYMLKRSSSTPAHTPNPTPKKISPYITRKGSNKMATDEATFKPLGRVTLQTHGTVVVDHFNNSTQVSAIEAHITSVSWSRNRIIILTPQESILLAMIHIELCPILNTVFGVLF
ncbi:hypothetical protein BOTBODRAFT_174097 [Botryobasidium botryosum FD-172 SS1]|uniref:Uncharacterized protein n=1 Tax=Botryobasidium botryosum (strain FD-172 SS1) TaxID=930990 RepID=A0A067MKI5_BOTB1|nr:hypothetical protein BOTBODRAFT_174097 [Botryobasidium botryosum FD-172 SS1]